jgi:hypothetical protein
MAISPFAANERLAAPLPRKGNGETRRVWPTGFENSHHRAVTVPADIHPNPLQSMRLDRIIGFATTLRLVVLGPCRRPTRLVL